jgi:hypothetical protein
MAIRRTSKRTSSAAQNCHGQRAEHNIVVSRTGLRPRRERVVRVVICVDGEGNGATPGGRDTVDRRRRGGCAQVAAAVGAEAQMACSRTLGAIRQ